MLEPRRSTEGLVWLPGGGFAMGSEGFAAAREFEAVDTSTGHIGFRCVAR